jgi:hypothetical protein
MDAKQVLDLEMSSNDADAATIRDYFKALLTAIITEEEGFSGKRPFGNSGWIGDLEQALVKASVVAGKLDENGWLDECDSDAAKVRILEAVKAL